MDDGDSAFVDRILDRLSQGGVADGPDDIVPAPAGPPGGTEAASGVDEPAADFDLWSPLEAFAHRVRHATVNYPTFVVFVAIFTSMVVITPPYVQDASRKNLSLRNATAAALLFTAIFKLSLDRFVLAG